jgi:hypothetical protein
VGNLSDRTGRRPVIMQFVFDEAYDS